MANPSREWSGRLPLQSSEAPGAQSRDAGLSRPLEEPARDHLRLDFCRTFENIQNPCVA